MAPAERMAVMVAWRAVVLRGAEDSEHSSKRMLELEAYLAASCVQREMNSELVGIEEEELDE